MSIKLLYIDLFCGAGGTSTGVEAARYNGKQCAKVIACVNHGPCAIASHAANHPDALHFTEDIRTLELSPLKAHVQKMKHLYPDAMVVLWASLECTNFSNAKGGLPRDADSRTLAEHLFRYIETIDPDYIQIENVREFMSWGPLDENGKPVSREKGTSYLRWVQNVQHYGYDYDWRILNSADFGAYTTRRRYFGQFPRKGLPFAWPAPTHSRDGGDDSLFGRTEKWICHIRFACDTKAQMPSVEKAVRLLGDHGIKPERIFCYVLVKQDTEDAIERLRFLKDLRVNPFAQPYRDFDGQVKITREQRRIARWCNHKAIFKTIDYSEYNTRK